MKEITLAHIAKAARWAMKSSECPRKIGIYQRWYNQRFWDCGTACCIWGAAHIIAGNGPDDGWEQGPPMEWFRKSNLHSRVAVLLCQIHTTPQQIIDLLKGSE